MIVNLYGGPLHRRHLEIPRDLFHLARLEVRITSLGRDGRGAPIPLAEQQVAIYARKDGHHAANRYFLGMGAPIELMRCGCGHTFDGLLVGAYGCANCEGEHGPAVPL